MQGHMNHGSYTVITYTTMQGNRNHRSYTDIQYSNIQGKMNNDSYTGITYTTMQGHITHGSYTDISYNAKRAYWPKSRHHTFKLDSSLAYIHYKLIVSLLLMAFKMMTNRPIDPRNAVCLKQ